MLSILGGPDRPQTVTGLLTWVRLLAEFASPRGLHTVVGVLLKVSVHILVNCLQNHPSDAFVLHINSTASLWEIFNFFLQLLMSITLCCFFTFIPYLFSQSIISKLEGKEKKGLGDAPALLTPTPVVQRSDSDNKGEMNLNPHTHVMETTRQGQVHILHFCSPALRFLHPAPTLCSVFILASGCPLYNDPWLCFLPGKSKLGTPTCPHTLGFPL